MELNNLENEIKNKLGQREINPSVNSWDRLDAMLSVTEEKKSKRSYSWLYIAASCIGFLFIGTVFFSQTEEIIDIKNNKVVYGLPKLNKQNVEKKAIEISEKKEDRSIVKILEEHPDEKISPELKLIKTAKKGINQNQIAEQLIINQKTEPLLPTKKELISVDEQLSSVVQNSRKENPNGSIKVDANSLLSQVDGELELSFREKVIQAVDKNYKTVKVALANRNQE